MTDVARGFAPRLVPWSSWTEWREVHDALSAASSAAQRSALKTIAGWRFRGKLPLAIEATASLLETLMNDESPETSPQRSDAELVLCYSMAICRFVNGFVDTAQKGQFAAPIHRLAEQLSIPLYLVEIRHDVTHGRLPTLAYLRMAAKDALKWLGVHYWASQALLLESLTGNRHACVARLEGLLSVYANARLRDLERAERTKLTPDEAPRHKRSRSAERKSSSPSAAVAMTRKTAESMKEVQQLLREADTQACLTDALDVVASALLGQLSSLPTEAFDERDPAYLWQPLLMRVHAYHYRLTERICIHIGEGRTAAQLLAGRWLRWCLTNFASAFTRTSLRSLLNALLSLAPSRPVRKASAAVLQKLKQVGELADEAVEYVDAALQLDAPGAEAEAEEEEAVTIEAMEARINGLLGRATTKSTPLGVLPSGALPDLSLPERLDHGDTQEGDAVCFVRPAKRSLAVTDVPSTVAPLRATDVTPAAANTFEIDLNDEMDADQTKTCALQPATLLFPMTELLPVQ